jgi:GntR family transcriptional regulator, transcriptional repressor for pyruvate dehydrogenase complex
VGQASSEPQSRDLDSALASLAPDESRTLLLFHSKSAPVGARLVKQELAAQGVTTSEASVSRVLVRLDAAGLTEAEGRKGRVLTPFGRAVAEQAIGNRRRNTSFNAALRIRSLEQLLDLLYARRGVEQEAARVAARRRTDEQLSELDAVIREHESAITRGADPTPSGMEFHRVIVRMAGSDLFSAVGDVIPNESLAGLERTLDVITGTDGTTGLSVPEHEPIRRAIAAQDGEAAARAMSEHLSRLISEVEDFAQRGNVQLFQRLLRVVN